MAPMDVQRALLTRRTVHRWVPGPLPPQALDDALLAALHAPNHKHTHPWRFTVVGAETRRRLADLAVRLKARSAALTPEQERSIRAKIEAPGALVVLRQVLAEDPFVREEDYASVACAAQNFMLSLHARGVGSKWGTGALTRAPETYALLGVDPERERICGFLYAGTPAAVPSPPKPSLEDVVDRLP
ncbi:MAG: hypothetical protein D6731_23155 [Planctomycetota bacterium]|nr:MAG: hypothetical protein D6731_23155 [Planctomycetota bacterium]